MKGIKKRIRAMCLLAVFLLLCGCDVRGWVDTHQKYTVEIRGVELCVGGDADEVISRLGESNSHSSAPSCAGVGEDELYIYSGFKLFVYRSGARAEISSVEIVNDTISTAEGIYIGDEEEKVISVYGEGKRIGEVREYEGNGVRLRFFIRGGRVRSIKYLKIDD